MSLEVIFYVITMWIVTARLDQDRRIWVPFVTPSEHGSSTRHGGPLILIQELARDVDRRFLCQRVATIRGRSFFGGKSSDAR